MRDSDKRKCWHSAKMIAKSPVNWVNFMLKAETYTLKNCNNLRSIETCLMRFTQFSEFVALTPSVVNLKELLFVTGGSRSCCATSCRIKRQRLGILVPTGHETQHVSVSQRFFSKGTRTLTVDGQSKWWEKNSRLLALKCALIISVALDGVLNSSDEIAGSSALWRIYSQRILETGFRWIWALLRALLRKKNRGQAQTSESCRQTPRRSKESESIFFFWKVFHGFF